MAVGVAERYRALRRVKKITLKEVSEKSGVPYSTLRRFESKGEISFLAFVKITSAIGEDDSITSLFADYVPASIEEVLRLNRLFYCMNKSNQDSNGHRK